MANDVLNIEDLSIIYKTDLETVYAVNGISFSLKEGETMGLVGETGAGKSIIVGALSFLMKGKADTSIIRTGQDKAMIEGISNPQIYEKILPYTAEWTELLVKGIAPRQ